MPGYVALAPLLLVAFLISCAEATPNQNRHAEISPTIEATSSFVITPPPAPGGVPAAATGVGRTMTLGTIVRRAGETPQGIMSRRLVDASCTSGLLVLETSAETIFATLPCDRFWDDTASEVFFGKEVSIQLEVTEERFRVLIETIDGALSEFTVGGIWVE